MLRTIKSYTPRFVFSVYHYTLALLGAIVYRRPSTKLTVIGVTGTNGKTTTTELINTIFEKAGYTTAAAGTLRFKIADTSEPNTKKMTMPGRMFMHSFLRRAVNADCDVAVIEMTSEGAKQYRHRFIALDALVFLNLTPEHIESHGSYERYRDAKLDIARELARSPKQDKAIIVNADDDEHQRFLEAAGNEVTHKTFSLHDAEPYEVTNDGITFTFNGTQLTSPLRGTFNLYNLLAASSLARTRGVPSETLKQAISSYEGVAGRVEQIDEGQPFTVIVDYAHTPDSLAKLYETFGGHTIIGVLGNAGGGRDTWKRPEMGSIADTHCSRIYLTNEDPYDEDPRAIVEQMRDAITDTPTEIIMDRREAIRAALSRAAELAQTDQHVAVLITGKGTDPYIMEADGHKTPWSDARVTKEELQRLTQNH